MRGLLLALLFAASASAQTDTTAARPAWLTLAPEFSYRLTPDGDAGPDYLGGSIAYYRTVGPVVASAGAFVSAEFFGSGALVEAHLAVGQSASVGPLFVTAAAGPSLGSAYSRRSGRSVVVPGVYASVQAPLVVFPFLGLGFEAFAHLNAVDPVAGVGIVYAFGRLPGAAFPNPPPTPRRPGP